jgi:hypothetical protein
MDPHARRLAAAAYDRARHAPPSAPDRLALTGIDLPPGLHRTLVCDVVLTGDPPESLRRAVADTLAVLRVAWIAMLKRGESVERGRLEATHAAMQCELVATEWAWSSGSPDPRALARSLVARRDRHVQLLAMPLPHGVGMLLPRHARANELLPDLLAEAHRELGNGLAQRDEGRARCICDAAYEAIGAWRLGEMEATRAARAIRACFEPPDPLLMPAA